MNYQDYLKSEEWQIKRGIALDRADNRCQLCNSSKNLQVHHRDYGRRGTNEELRDLVVLCNSCHKKFHDILEFKVNLPKGNSKIRLHPFNELTPQIMAFTRDDVDFIGAFVFGNTNRLLQLARRLLKDCILPNSVVTKLLKILMDHGISAVFDNIEPDETDLRLLWTKVIYGKTGYFEKNEELVIKRIISLIRHSILLDEKDLEQEICEAKRTHDIQLETQLSMRRIGLRKEMDYIGSTEWCEQNGIEL